MRKRRVILFELHGRSGNTICNSIRNFTTEDSDEKIQAEFKEWKEEALSEISANWSDYDE
ncbi:hypothetical protein NST04_33605 [Paenibacillus sp. FSL H7-0756]|uniref:hypothetical protein n=1 Tax=Paenibacillus sp. FSL H7-0756 TaxID=2954738 RepID=UPI0030F950E5